MGKDVTAQTKVQLLWLSSSACEVPRYSYFRDDPEIENKLRYEAMKTNIKTIWWARGGESQSKSWKCLKQTTQMPKLASRRHPEMETEVEPFKM